MICNNQLTTVNNNQSGITAGISTALRAMGNVGADVLLHTGLLTISATALFTAFWFTLYFLV